MKPKNRKATIKSENGFAEVIDFIKAWDFEQPCKVHIYGGGSTLDYKATFAIWMRDFAAQFNERGHPTDKKGSELRILFYYQFLGMTKAKLYKDGTVIPPQQRTITYPEDLNKGQWYDFMRKVEDKAQSWGLTIPENDNEFSNDKAKEVA